MTPPTPKQARREAEQAERDAERAALGEYPRYGRAVYLELAQTYRRYAEAMEATEAEAQAEGDDWEARQRRRVARLRRRAAWTKIQAVRASCESHDIASRRPFGQPILVGHHSERGHRRDLARSRWALQSLAS